MCQDAKWKHFERLVAAIHYAVEQGGQVTWNDRINGRQFDVSIRFKRGFYTFLTVIECKDYKKSVPVEKVEAFVTKAIDAKANKAIMVISSSFQDGCLSVAERHNVGLYTLKEVNELPKEVAGSQLSPAFNIFDIQLVNIIEHLKYEFPEYGGKLLYLMKQTRIKIENSDISLDDLISQWMQDKTSEVNDQPKDFCFNFDNRISAYIPQEDGPFLFNKVIFKCKYVNVHLVRRPILDPYLIQKLNTNFIYKDEVSGDTHKLDSSDIAFGFETKFEEGKFYFNPKLEFFYYCDSINNGIATIYLVESYQHGDLWQVVFQQSIQYSKYYVEVTDLGEIRRLNKLLKKMKT